MTPPIESFPASELPDRVQVTMKGRRRKRPVDMRNCELLEMLQYSCWIDGDERKPGAKVICDPVVRLFRRCADNLTIETTTWEGKT